MTYEHNKANETTECHRAIEYNAYTPNWIESESNFATIQLLCVCVALWHIATATITKNSQKIEPMANKNEMKTLGTFV